MKPIAFLLVGVPASGKSTWYKNNKDTFPVDHVYISSDKFIEEYATSVNKTYNEVFSEYIGTATNKMIDQLNDATDNQKFIVWDQTNLTKKTRARKIGMLRGYEISAIALATPDLITLQTRLDSRVGKNIPPTVLAEMIVSYEEPTKTEGFFSVTLN